MPTSVKKSGVEEMPAEMSMEDAYKEVSEKLAEAEKVINTLNERLAKVIRLYNTVVDMYIQDK